LIGAWWGDAKASEAHMVDEVEDTPPMQVRGRRFTKGRSEALQPEEELLL